MFLVCYGSMGYLRFLALSQRPWPLTLKLYLPYLALNLFLTLVAPNLCFPVVRFTVKVCYSYLYKLNVYLSVLAF